MTNTYSAPPTPSEQPSNKVCWRCGVDYDPRKFIDGAPCEDCQLDDPPTKWLRADVLRKAENDRINDLVRHFWSRRYSDVEIGAAIGMTGDGVQRRRAKMGLAAHKFTGSEKWRNPEQVMEDIRAAANAKVRSGAAFGKGKFAKADS